MSYHVLCNVNGDKLITVVYSKRMSHKIWDNKLLLDQVLTTVFLLLSFSTTTFLDNLTSTNGPFLMDLAMISLIYYLFRFDFLFSMIMLLLAFLGARVF